MKMEGVGTAPGEVPGGSDLIPWSPSVDETRGRPGPVTLPGTDATSCPPRGIVNSERRQKVGFRCVGCALFGGLERPGLFLIWGGGGGGGICVCACARVCHCVCVMRACAENPH